MTRVQFFADAIRGSADKSSIAADEGFCRMDSIEVRGTEVWLSRLELVKKALLHYGNLAYRAKTSGSVLYLRLCEAGPSKPIDNMPGNGKYGFMLVGESKARRSGGNVTCWFAS